jgi:hypothetical protein
MRVDLAAREWFSVYRGEPTGFHIGDGIVTLAIRN